jgi:hypothetical protein
VQLNPKDPVATPIVARIDELFAVDAGARPCSASGTIAIAAGIRKQIEAARSTALPAGALAKACNYTLTLWEKLNRFLEYPELELSNNLAENSMTDRSQSEKIGIPLKSPLAGPKIKTILSVVESCRRLNLSVRDHLAAVLPGLADRPIQRLPHLTPAAWVAQHSQTQTTGLLT